METIVMQKTQQPPVAELTTLADAAGFTAASAKVTRDLKLAARMARAYEHYRVVKQERINAFNEQLCNSTIDRSNPYLIVYDMLVFDQISDYQHMPPAEVLGAVKEAAKTGIFDTFEVAHIQTQRVVHDPIVFGRIEGSTDRWFVAQWGEDVKISDLLSENEG